MKLSSFLVFLTLLSCGPTTEMQNQDQINKAVENAVEEAFEETASTSTTSTSTSTTSTSTSTTSTSTSTSTTIPYKYEYWGLMFDKTYLTRPSNFVPWEYLDGFRFCIPDGQEGYFSDDLIMDEDGFWIDFSKPVTKFINEIMLRGYTVELVTYSSTDKLIKDFSLRVCDMAYLEIQTINELIDNNNKKDIWLIHRVFEIIKP